MRISVPWENQDEHEQEPAGMHFESVEEAAAWKDEYSAARRETWVLVKLTVTPLRWYAGKKDEDDEEEDETAVGHDLPAIVPVRPPHTDIEVERELAAMRKVAESLDRLSHEQKTRVLEWARVVKIKEEE